MSYIKCSSEIIESIYNMYSRVNIWLVIIKHKSLLSLYIAYYLSSELKLSYRGALLFQLPFGIRIYLL
jgi:hypothetical protein